MFDSRLLVFPIVTRGVAPYLSSINKWLKSSKQKGSVEVGPKEFKRTIKGGWCELAESL